MPVIDSHCHLDYPDLTEDLEGVLSRAGAAGVELLVTIGTELKNFDRVRAIAEAHENVWCTVGVHPHNASQEPDVSVDDLLCLSGHPKVIGIGEAGLDYHYDHSPRDVQAASFRTHIAAARASGLPLVIHSREAEEDTARILEEEMSRGPLMPLLHCFSSKRELARRGVALGAYVSFSGILTYKNAEEVRAAAAEIPVDRLLVETDAPYLAPVPHRGRTNEPAFIVNTLDKLAGIKGVTPRELALRTNDNFFRLFTKVSRPLAFASAA
jgi:TatD DNase family protein